MNGTLMNTSTARPMATVAPEKITEWPAVTMVRTTAVSLSYPAFSSSLKRETISSE